ncbi:MAG TPA: hypothetical protein ENI37_02035 [Chloroflexi bacterium]|nr:hypothetical protein [Chloroflexota bacterium]
MSSYTVRSWVTIGLFGALWGVVEMTLGSVLHTIFPPQANTFLTGVVMGGIGVAVALTGRHFVPLRGSVLFIGVVTALLKLLSPGGARLGPFVAIVMESILMEAVLCIARTKRRWAFVLGGALAVGWNFFHKFVMMRLLFGKGIVEVYTKMVRDGSQMLGLDVSAALLILAVLLVVRLVVGGIGGWSAWELGGAVARRLGRRSPAASEAGH